MSFNDICDKITTSVNQVISGSFKSMAGFKICQVSSASIPDELLNAEFQFAREQDFDVCADIYIEHKLAEDERRVYLTLDPLVYKVWGQIGADFSGCMNDLGYSLIVDKYEDWLHED